MKIFWANYFRNIFAGGGGGYIGDPKTALAKVGNGPNTVSWSTVSNTKLSEFFRGSLSSGERTQWVPLSLLFMCQSELTEFLAELTEFAPKLSEAQWVLFSETVLSKQYSARFLKSARGPFSSGTCAVLKIPNSSGTKVCTGDFCASGTRI